MEAHLMGANTYSINKEEGGVIEHSDEGDIKVELDKRVNRLISSPLKEPYTDIQYDVEHSDEGSKKWCHIPQPFTGDPPKVRVDGKAIGEEFVETTLSNTHEWDESIEPVGKKFDSGKLDWTLLPFSALDDAVRVLMFGAQKYDRENWKLVKDGEQRYKAAGFRHMLASLEGEEFDPETGVRHTAHAMVNLIFAEWLRKEREGK